MVDLGEDQLDHAVEDLVLARDLVIEGHRLMPTQRKPSPLSVTPIMYIMTKSTEDWENWLAGPSPFTAGPSVTGYGAWPN